MSYHTRPEREYASTYFVQDRSNQEEMTRLEVENRLLTSGMGGVLPELAEPVTLRCVLDVGCGPGGWLLETARTYPIIEELIGIDISNKMLAYARAQAKAQQLSERVEFHTMDALRPLEFADESFDLVNQRLGSSWLRTWEWTKVLSEYQRITCPGGIIRITDTNISLESNSAAVMKLNNIILETLARSGHLFTASGDGLINKLAQLLTLHGIQGVQTKVHTLVYRGGTVEGRYFYENILHMYHVGLPFFQKWMRLPKDYEDLHQQALKDVQQPNFVVKQFLLTAWGIKGRNKKTVELYL
jgi:ubiquinone/menaquinone biosynthesis C-methylase UbiE